MLSTPRSRSRYQSTVNWQLNTGIGNRLLQLPVTLTNLFGDTQIRLLYQFM